VVEKVDASVTNIDGIASKNPQNPAAYTTAPLPGFSPVANGVWLDHRNALVHPVQGWLAIADLHFGYEHRRRRAGHLTPDWGTTTLKERLSNLLIDHHPTTLILVGDIMDGSANLREALDFLAHLRSQVPRLIPIIGNHDRAITHRDPTFVTHHQEPGFFFHHGHEPLPETNPSSSIIITGHHHPAVSIKDGAGLHLKLSALIREQLHNPKKEQWVLPAFSPWAAGGEYTSPHTRLATWVCAPNRVWQI
jgi:metallophosphoesterase superfamily enzyme